jgi:mRNA interferase MazF
MMTTYSQYEIVVVNLDPTVGSEIKKKRPCLIVSPNEMNKHLATIVVCPITSQSRDYPTRVRFDLEGQTNWIVIDQIRTIDKSRITKTIGHLDDDTIEQVKDVIKETYVD